MNDIIDGYNNNPNFKAYCDKAAKNSSVSLQEIFAKKLTYYVYVYYCGSPDNE